MAKKTFEEIKPWDGTTGTGSEARQVIKNNFNLVNDAIEEIEDIILNNGKIIYNIAEVGDDVFSSPAITAFGVYRLIEEDALVNELSVYASASTEGRTVQTRVYKSATKPAYSNIPNVHFTEVYSGTAVWDADETILKKINIPATSFAAGEYLVVMFASFVTEAMKIRRYSTDIAGRSGFLYSLGTEPTQVFDNQFGSNDDGSEFSQAMPGIAYVSEGYNIEQLENAVLALQLGKAEKVLPRITLPSIINSVVGTELNLYYDAMTLGIPGAFSVEVLTDIGQSLERMYQVTPENGEEGVHELIVNVYNSNKELIESKTVILRVIALISPLDVKNILLIGDSTLNNGPVAPTIRANFVALGANTPLFWGGKGVAPAQHQGWPGAAVVDFATVASWGTLYEFEVTDSTGVETDATYTNNGSTFFIQEIYTVLGDGKIRAYRSSGSNEPLADGTLTKVGGEGPATIPFSDVAVVSPNPFWNTATSELDIANYRSMLAMGTDKFDVVTIRLGVNDSFGELKTEENRLGVINNLKAIITAFVDDNALTKFIIELPTTDGNTRSGWGVNYGASGLRDTFQANVWRLRELIIEHFDNAEYSANVEVCATGCMVDRYFGFELAEVQSSSRITETEIRHTNAVHPTTGGYYQLADAIFPHILKFIQ
jgi:hypothetical protein